MRSFAFLLFLILIHFNSAAQGFDWSQRLGNIKSDKITAVRTDGQGFIYIAGYFSTGITIGTNALQLNYVANTQSKEAFIAKLDSTGYCLWAKAGGQYFDDRVLGLDVDSAGNSVITGTFWEGSGINFPPVNVSGSAYGSGDQCFIVKFDPAGVPLWGKFVCGQSYGDDQGLDVVMDKVGNIYTVGFMTNSTLICGGSGITATNPNTTGPHNHCYWVTKMNSSGVFQWARTFGNLPWDPDHFKYVERDIAVCVDEKDGIYITGGFDGTRQFGTQSFTSLGGHDAFVMKYDSSGNFIWATQAGSSKDDWSNGICSDKNGHIYITGEHRDSLFMDTVLVKNYDKRDVFIFKIDAATGKPYWGKRAGSNLGSERGNDVWADDHCNVYVCGDINDGAKFGDNLVLPVNGLDVQAFVARITPEGKWQWVVTGGGPGEEDRGNAIAKGKARQLYLAGFFRVTATYGTTVHTSAGSSDGVLTRLTDSMHDIGSPFVLTAPAKTILCFDDTAHLTIPEHTGFGITPTTGIQFNADTSELIFSPTVTTTYTMTGFTAGACGSYDTLSFTIQTGKPLFTIARPPDTAICPGESIDLAIMPHDHFQVTPTAGVTLDAAESLLNFAPAVTTTYTLSGYNTGVCANGDTQVVTIIANPDPVAAFSVIPQTVYIENPVFALINTTTGAGIYNWYDEYRQLFSTDVSPLFTAPAVGDYCFKLVAVSSAGCMDSTEACGKVIRRELVFFPTVFSPNGDARNDEYKPLLTNIDFNFVRGYCMTIYNRYGQVVYSGFDAGRGWNGTFQGVNADMGTYFYTCRFETPQGELFNVRGEVVLVR